jgi:hypothetical protein
VLGQSQLKVIRRVLASAFLAGFMACVFSQIYIENTYAARMPASPQPETGRVYRVGVNRVWRYVNQKEFARANFVLNTLQWPEFLLLASLMFLRVRYKDL